MDDIVLLLLVYQKTLWRQVCLHWFLALNSLDCKQNKISRLVGLVSVTRDVVSVVSSVTRKEGNRMGKNRHRRGIDRPLWSVSVTGKWKLRRGAPTGQPPGVQYVGPTQPKWRNSQDAQNVLVPNFPFRFCVCVLGWGWSNTKRAAAQHAEEEECRHRSGRVLGPGHLPLSVGFVVFPCSSSLLTSPEWGGSETRTTTDPPATTATSHLCPTQWDRRDPLFLTWRPHPPVRDLPPSSFSQRRTSFAVTPNSSSNGHILFWQKKNAQIECTTLSIDIRATQQWLPAHLSYFTSAV